MSRPLIQPYIPNENALIEAMLDNFAKSFQTCIPAIVKNVISRDTVEVSPAVLLSDSDNNPVEWANVTTTVLTPFSGGMFLSMPLAVGDTGWLVASDLDTSLFKKEKKEAQQNLYTRHQYQYGFFVPDAINGYTVSEDDEGAIVLSTTNGKTKITMKHDEINVVSDDKLKINAKSITIDSSNNNVVIDGINFKNHTHTVPAGQAVSVNTTTGSGATTGVIVTQGVDDV